MGDPNSIGDESQEEIERGIEAMQVVIDLRAENTRLREALRSHSHNCEFLHHAKRDQHEHGERCPVEVRVNAALHPEAAAEESGDD